MPLGCLVTNRSTGSVSPMTCDECVNKGFDGTLGQKGNPKWTDLPTDPHDGASDFRRRDARGTTLVKAPCWMIRRPPLSKRVAQEMRDRHPPPRRGNFSRLPSLPCLSPSAHRGPTSPPLLCAGLSRTVGPPPTTCQGRPGARLQRRGHAFPSRSSPD